MGAAQTQFSALAPAALGSSLDLQNQQQHQQQQLLLPPPLLQFYAPGIAHPVHDQDTSNSFRMTDKLPPNLLALFAPRPALRWVPPSDHAPQERKTATISGLAAFLPALEEYKEKDVYEPTESWLQRKDRLRLEKRERQERLLKEGPANCESPLQGHSHCRYDSIFVWSIEADLCDLQITHRRM